MSKAAELAKMGEVLTNNQIGGRRNIVINGSMKCSQRSTSATSITSTGYHALDRFALLYTDAGTWTMAQSSTAPTGFANSLKLDCTATKASLASDSRLFLQTKIEGQDVQQLKKGTSDAEYVTLSFYVRSNKTGTYQVNIEDNDNTRIIGATYTIDSADTWERKVIPFIGDTTGAFADDTGDSLAIMWALVAGDDNSTGAVPTSWEAKVNTDRGAGLNVNLADNTSNEWLITGVQLEVGNYPSGTPFEHRSFGEELQLCQRYYYERMGSGAALAVSGGQYQWAMNGIAYNTTLGIGGLSFPTPMRATPTLGYSDVAHFIKQTAGRGDNVTAINLYDGVENATTSTAYIQFNSATSTAGGAIMTSENSSARLNFDAEL